jgi:hypothetical protein
MTSGTPTPASRAAGFDIKVVSDRLGHSTTAITADLYTHVNRNVWRAAAYRIAEALTAR